MNKKEFMTKLVALRTPHTMAKLAFVLALSLLQYPDVYGQAVGVGGVSRIYTDFNGYWTSSTGSISSVKPNKSHHLSAYTWNGKTYSTGVDDSSLERNNVPFVPAVYQAFPVRNIASTTSTYVGLGQIQDGVHGGISSSPPFPVPPNLANFLTDGLQGLDIGTGVANIKAGELIFDFTGIIDRYQIADSIPDILVSQIADPSSTTDEIYLADAQGKMVGRRLSITHNRIPSVGKWRADFYKLNGKETAFTDEDRDLRLWVAELSAFGINEENFHLVKSMRYRLNGTSDPAFAAFKVGVFDIISANNDEAESKKGEVVEIDVLKNDQPSTYLDPKSVRIKTAPTNGIATTDLVTGAISYTPHSIFYGIDSFVYEVCSNASEADLCDEATVDVSVRAYILPIVLLNFSAEPADKGQIKLHWTTAGETNNLHFEVEHSANARDWKTINRIVGAGNSSSTLHYTALDREPVNGYNYYRLKQVDANGQFEIFEAISVKVQSQIPLSITLFPNPTSDILTVKGDPAELRHLAVTNSFGQLQVINGKVRRVGDSHVVLDIQHLSPGIYILRTATGGEVFRKR
jgi:hypothetical protein